MTARGREQHSTPFTYARYETSNCNSFLSDSDSDAHRIGFFSLKKGETQIQRQRRNVASLYLKKTRKFVRIRWRLFVVLGCSFFVVFACALALASVFTIFAGYNIFTVRYFYYRRIKEKHKMNCIGLKLNAIMLVVILGILFSGNWRYRYSFENICVFFFFAFETKVTIVLVGRQRTPRGTQSCDMHFTYMNI